MKKLFFCWCLCTSVVAHSQLQVFDITTGRFDGGVLIPPNGVDDTWEVMVPGGGVYTDVYSCISNGPDCSNDDYNWAYNNCGNWITRVKCPDGTANECAPGIYHYRTSFNLNNVGCGVTFAEAQFNFIAGDNQVLNVWVNGNQHQVTQNITHTSLSTLVLPIPASELVSGNNTLVIDVNNWNGIFGQTWTGFFCCGQIQVITNDSDPTLIPSITGDQYFCEGEALSFVGSDGAGTATSHYWEIHESDGSWNPIPGGYEWHQWYSGTPGAYTFPVNPPCGKYYKIKLAVKNDCEIWVEISHLIYIYCNPDVDLGPDQVGCLDQGVAISATPCTAGFNYSWDQPFPGNCMFGGCNMQGCNSGNYCVSVTNPNTGCVGEDCVNVTLEDCTSCILGGDIYYQIDANNCATAIFQASITTNQATTITGYLWNFGDGTTSNDANPSHTYLYNGNYNVTLIVYGINKKGECCTIKLKVAVEIYCDCKVLPQNYIVTELDDCTYQFSIDPPIIAGTTQITLVHWDFGDGTVGYGSTVTHQYLENGSYLITLTISGFNGRDCCTGEPQTFELNTHCEFDCKLDPYFTFTEDNGVITFTNASGTNYGTQIIGFFWEFGDGSTSTDANPVHNYGTTGYFNACLTIYGFGGDRCCEDKICYVVHPMVVRSAPYQGSGNMQQLPEGSNQPKYDDGTEMINIEEKGTVSAQPNPSTGEVLISYKLIEDELATTIEIVDMKGAMVYQANLTNEQQNHRWNPDAKLATGIYLVRVTTSKGVYEEKIIRNE